MRAPQFIFRIQEADRDWLGRLCQVTGKRKSLILRALLHAPDEVVTKLVAEHVDAVALGRKAKTAGAQPTA